MPTQIPSRCSLAIGDFRRDVAANILSEAEPHTRNIILPRGHSLLGSLSIQLKAKSAKHYEKPSGFCLGCYNVQEKSPRPTAPSKQGPPELIIMQNVLIIKIALS